MQTKNIKQLLLEYNIAVPEIQREYVWGKNESVLSQFLEDLNKNASKSCNVGFLYSYEPGYSRNEIYLIDGQQRFTTLLLLAFYLALKENKKRDFDILLKIDSSTPAFSYRVRSLTEIFLYTMWKSTDSLDSLLKIKDRPWYVSAYEDDMTIQAMLSSLYLIRKFDEAHQGNFHLKYESCITDVEFWYFNVGQTSQGEELYITMNSRGEQLTDSEQIKPLLFAKAKKDKTTPKYCSSWGKAWDNWEEFFFSLKSDNQSISNVENSIDLFIKIIVELRSLNEHNKIEPTKDIDSITLSDIEMYFEALKQLSTHPLFAKEIKRLLDNKNIKFNTADSNFLILKSLLTAYLRKFEDERDYLRLFKIISNSLRRGIINHVPLLLFLKRFSESKANLYDFIIEEAKDGRLDKVLDTHELDKINIYSATHDTEIEDLFWYAEEHIYTRGSIKCIWHEKFTSDASARSKWEVGDKVLMEKRIRIFEDIFSPKHTQIYLSQSPKVDKIDNALITRALLACYGDYSYNTGGNNWCYGYNDYWATIIKNSPKAISTLIDKLYQRKKIDFYTHMNNIISEYLGSYDLTQKDGMYYVLKYEDSLQALNQGYNILRFANGEWGNYWIDILNKERASSYNINLFRYLVYKHLHDKSIVKNQWLEMENGLTLDCATHHGWIISYRQESTQDDIKKYQTEIERVLGTDYNITLNENKRLFYIPIELNKDLILEGVYIVEHIHSISIV